ncbi:LuxR C-terminal-related transcriptional regulator [Actinomadura namibiensis]|uniref:DNA-binding CsgD family transcriptional regulator n=1 Tax=Actinomadura namibiensis TaxID=182080 RepID=A0A7W3LYI2_ACTNM|nr:LuxR C-terminal-related transcriptional regulator [Actinomadura namibiensis]MBA8956567.1 DNA-binding CsgD family transcriptional regulator [Actinomadura namibiensis]
MYRAYRSLVEAAGRSCDEPAEALGGADVVAALLERGMAYRRPEPGGTHRLIPAPPDLALQGALTEMNQRLAEEHERFLTGHRRLAEARPTPTASEPSSAAGLIQVITEPDEITRLSGVLVNAARHDWLTLENYLADRPIDETAIVAPPPALRKGVHRRTIYDSRCAEHPVVAKNIATAAELGEEARLLADVGMKMKLADASVAMLPLGPTGMTGAVLVRSPVIVAALRQYFELLWERALPIGAVQSDSPLTEELRAILELLVQGADDEAIARRLKISATTVRRRITAIREELGTPSRFAAGAAAVRRGWIK